MALEEIVKPTTIAAGLYAANHTVVTLFRAYKRVRKIENFNPHYYPSDMPQEEKLLNCIKHRIVAPATFFYSVALTAIEGVILYTSCHQ
jgi:hypothetical protein